jgi:hypothetical protein
MKYPKHIILDLKTTNSDYLVSNWEGEFARTTDLSLGFELSKLELRATPRLLSLSNFTLKGTSVPNSLTSSIFDIHFLRKEKLYTKLKYSRCPQYDIVSGGFAALLAGFIGFLISEKFGIELVDSGDFYNAFMYGVFGAFAIRPLLRSYSQDNTPYSPLSPKYLLTFSRDLLIILIRSVGLSMRSFRG